MAKYRVVDPKNEDKFEELARISFNLRYFSKIWKEQYGATNRTNMALWEQKLDKWHQDNLELDLPSDLEADLTPKGEKWLDECNR